MMLGIHNHKQISMLEGRQYHQVRSPSSLEQLSYIIILCIITIPYTVVIRYIALQMRLFLITLSPIINFASKHISSRAPQMTSKKQFDYEMALGDLINDEIELRLVIDGLEDFDAEDLQVSKQKLSATNRLGEGIFDKNRTNIQELVNRQEMNFKEELDYEGGKKYRNMKIYEEPRFRLLGYSQEGKPLFKISDMFLTSDIKLMNIIDKYFNEIIHGNVKNAILETGELSRKYEKNYDFNKLIENWQKKQYEDYVDNKKYQMDQQQLQQIVVNRGDSKDNYWIHKIGQKKLHDYHDIFEHRHQQKSQHTIYYNHNLFHQGFVQNVHKAANRLRLQYAQIQQFQSDDQNDNTSNGDINNNNNGVLNANIAIMNKNQLQEMTVPLWGELKTKDPQLEKIQRAPITNPVRTIVVEGQIKQIASFEPKKDNKSLVSFETDKDNSQETFVEQIIKNYNIINHQIVNNKYQGKDALNAYNRIEFHLENPNFFLTKLHYALQKRSEQFSNYLQGTNKNINQIGTLNRNISAQSGYVGERSFISDSRTANNQQTIRGSQLQGHNNYVNDDDDHQTIENKILREMSLQSKKPINHSQIATKLQFIKFSNELTCFKNFHRFQYKFDLAFDKAVRIKLIRHPKPLKCKGTDFNINIEKKDSYTKFSRAESISLASEEIKQFILIEYIEENPLLMSDVGMCQRMILQVNNKEMLNRIHSDIIEGMEIEAYEEIRDNPMKNKETANTTTEQKMQLWRKNLKNYFGENGKVFLWQPKRQSKLIGNPEGLGIALMESNLAAMPIVKKTPNKRDFLLVRDGDKWVLRKIDAIYISGQVQPKQVVFSPGDRPYQTFLQKYQMDFLIKMALNSNNYKITIQNIKGHFPNTPQTSAQSRIRKILKQKMKTQTKDNKTYQIKINQDEEIKFKLDPQQFCLYQRMQKSLWELDELGIHNIKNMEKMKSILRKYFRKNKSKDLERFATARMIRDQLQLTSWYLTESFRKFIDKNARIEMVGHADPTNGHGGYSFIKKPQKQRTDKDEAQQKQEKSKLSGTQFDLRKLKAEQSMALLEQLGYSIESLKNYTRWQLVNLLKSQKDTEYSRKERQSKELKEQNQRKQRSKALNILLKNLRNEQQGLIQPFQYNYDRYLSLEYYCKREMNNWQNAKDKLDQSLRLGNENDENQNQDDGEDED